MPRLLELFCGTKSIGRAFEAAGWEVVSLDIVSKFEPTILCDIRSWDYALFPPGHSGWTLPTASTGLRAGTTVDQHALETEQGLCSRCDAWEDGRHLRGAQGGPRLMGGQRERVRGQSRELLYSIPTALCKEIPCAATAELADRLPD